MQSWFKKVGKQNRKKQKQLELIFSLFLGLFTIFTLGLYFFLFISKSYTDSSNEMGLILAILSAIVTFEFEIYEWVYLFKKDKSNKHSLIPSICIFITIMVFIIIFFKIEIHQLCIWSLKTYI